MHGLTSEDVALFALVARRGSFAAAADDLGPTASALSKSLSRIEDKLGVRLIERTTRRLALTAEGEILLAHAAPVTAAVEAAEAEVVAGRGRPRGRVRVSVGSAFALHRLSPGLPRFTARHPDVTLEILVTDRRVDLLAEGVDVAVRTGPLFDSTLIARRLGDSRRRICASPSYLDRRGVPRRTGDLADHDCLTLAGMSALAEWPFRVDGRVRPVRVAGPVTSDSAEVLRDLALNGTGIVRLLDFLIEAAVADGRLVEILADCHESEPVPLWAVRPPGRQPLPRVRVFLDFLAEIAAAAR